MVRDKRFLVDNQGGFYDLKSDLLQNNNLAQTTDRELSGHRDRLKAVLDNMPADAGPPFALYRAKRAKKK